MQFHKLAYRALTGIPLQKNASAQAQQYNQMILFDCCRADSPLQSAVLHQFCRLVSTDSQRQSTEVQDASDGCQHVRTASEVKK